MDAVSAPAFLVGCVLPLVYVAYTDWKEYMIYDRATYAIALAGLIAAIYEGRVGDSLAGALFGFALMFVFCAIKGAGGGDVKLATALGMWFGLQAMPYLMLLSSLLGVAWGAYKLAKIGLLRQRMKVFFTGLFLRLVYGVRGAVPMPHLPDDEDAPPPPDAVPFGTCMAVGAWVLWAVGQFMS